jgi:hypothetical protein
VSTYAPYDVYRVGASWKTHTIIRSGIEPADERGRRSDDLPVAWVDSAAPEGWAAEVCRRMNAVELRSCDDPECAGTLAFAPRDVQAACPVCGKLGWAASL